MSATRSLAASIGGAIVALAVSSAALGQEIGAGVFTDAQAARGGEAYATSCAMCHGVDLHSVDAEAPDLTAFSFTIQWIGKTVGERYEAIKTTMPAQAPDSLLPQVYLDIIAYILSANGYPAGAGELTPEADLAAIEITRLQ